MQIFFLVCTLLLQSQLIASDLFREHKLTEEAFQKKTREVYQAGLSIIGEGETSSTSTQPKIPLITHTFLSTKREGTAPLLSEDQKQWFSTSIDTLPGWQHILWVTEDPTSISPQDLGSLAGRIEVRSIDAFSLPCVLEINKLLEFNLNKHASAMFGYAVLAKHGGVVRGLDAEIIQDLAPLNSTFNFYADIDSAQFIDTRFLASAPGHAVIRQALKLVQNHVNKAATKDKLLAAYQTRYASGPLSLAFQQWGTTRRDIIFANDLVSSVFSLETRVIEHSHVGFPVSAEAEEASLTLDRDSLELLSLYRKHFMDGGHYTNEETLQDFLNQYSGVTEQKCTEEPILQLSLSPGSTLNWLTVESLLRKNRVKLNLLEREFPGRVLPWFIEQQTKRRLEINWCETLPQHQSLRNDVIYPDDFFSPGTPKGALTIIPSRIHLKIKANNPILLDFYEEFTKSFASLEEQFSLLGGSFRYLNTTSARHKEAVVQR